MRPYEFETFLEKRIEDLGLTRTETAKQAGISRQALNNLITGLTGQAKITTVTALARVLKTHPVYLFQLLLSKNEFPKYIANSKYVCDATGFIADVTIPDNSLVRVNQTFIKTWEIQNTGAVDWVRRRLRCVDEPINSLPSSNSFTEPKTQRGLLPTQSEVDIPETLAGQTVRISVEFTAPSYPCTVFSYWKMVDSNGELCFPQLEGLSCHVRVDLL